MNRKWLHELPYLLIALYATKIGQAWRLTEGTDAAHMLMSIRWELITLICVR